ncbi:hypothetical protein, partial [Escherichia coli]|uniref:hypothetical protein n=1 Tax=Escherichia coli TaxID=562 RepID=UPI00396CC2AA
MVPKGQDSYRDHDHTCNKKACNSLKLQAFLCTENPQLGWGFRKAFSFKPVIKTPFDLLKHLAVWQLQVSN